MLGASHTLLIVDDDAEIRDLLQQILVKYGFTVISAATGTMMLAVLKKQPVDLILLDILLPDEDGISLCRKLRQNYAIPIIMVTAVGETVDRVVALEIGADDYVTKPFESRELIARIKAVIRRSEGITHKSVNRSHKHAYFCGWKLDLNQRRLISPVGIEVSLSNGEYTLLLAFLHAAQQVLSRDQLLDYTKNRSAGPFDRSIDIQVSRLRCKIEKDPKNPCLIKTIRGGGYFFAPGVEWNDGLD